MTEPRIGYAVFNRDGTQAEPGTTNARAGYGIINTPRGFYGVVTDTPDDPDLEAFLGTAKLLWNREQAVAQFNAAEDKWQLFVGKTIDAIELNRSELSLRVRHTAWFTVSYRATSLHCGIMEPTEITNAFRNAARKLVSAVTDSDLITTLTFDDGLTFSLMPLYFGITNAAPVWATPSGEQLINLKEAN